MPRKKSRHASLGDDSPEQAIGKESAPDCFDEATQAQTPATPSVEPLPQEITAFEQAARELKPMTAGELRGEAPSTSVTPSEVQASGLLPADLPKRNPGSRPWATRYAPPEVKYDVVAKKNAKGAPTLFIKFHGIKDGEKPTPEILAVMQGHKTTPEGYRTGLRFEHDPIEGKGWQLPDTPEGRDVLWSIERGLDKLAHKIASEQGWER